MPAGTGLTLTRYVFAVMLVRSADGARSLQSCSSPTLPLNPDGYPGYWALPSPRRTCSAPSLPAASTPPARVFRLIWRSGPLRRTLTLTIVVAFSVVALPIYAVAIAPGFGGAALAGTLVAGYGVGNLVGSALLMARPLRGDADRLTTILAATVAMCIALVAPMPNFIAVLVAFTAAGVVNALFFAATLAARSEYAPAQVRGQVFVWVGALKIAAGSVGTAITGALVGSVAWIPVVAVAALSGVVSLVCAIERFRTG